MVDNMARFGKGKYAVPSVTYCWKRAEYMDGQTCCQAGSAANRSSRNKYLILKDFMFSTSRCGAYKNQNVS